MSLNAFAIMLKPILANYLQPLEENGTIAKLQADIELVAKSNAIPELATLVSELQRHNVLMERFFQMLESEGLNNESRKSSATGNVEPGSDTGAAGFVGDSGDRMPCDAISD